MPSIKSKKISFHIFSYPLGISESIIQSVQGFANNGFDVDIYIDECSFERSPITFSEKNITVIEVELIDNPNIDLRNLFSDQIPDLINFLDVNVRFPKYPLFLKNMIQQTQGANYDLIIGVELFGLISAHLLSTLQHAPQIYYNLELFKKSHCKYKEELILKKLEINASSSCSLVIIPDSQRGAVLIKENKIEESFVRFLPVSTKGAQIKNKHGFFRQKFNISSEKKILIYAGHFADWALCMEIVQSSNFWPDPYVLIMHTWQNDVKQSDYYNELKKRAGANVFFSIDPIDREIFPMALSSADAGLMFYNQVDENNTETGSSSNKLTQYFKAGLPVIASDALSIREIFDCYGCGKCVSSPFEIQEVLDNVFNHLEKYRHGVSKAYKEHYNFDVHFKPLLKEINDLFF